MWRLLPSVVRSHRSSTSSRPTVATSSCSSTEMQINLTLSLNTLTFVYLIATVRFVFISLSDHTTDLRELFTARTSLVSSLNWTTTTVRRRSPPWTELIGSPPRTELIGSPPRTELVMPAIRGLYTPIQQPPWVSWSIQDPCQFGA